MAEVQKQKFFIEQTDELFKKACISFDIQFTSREVSDNVPFGVFMLLMERDEEFEKYHKTNNGVFSFSFSPFNLTNTGNHICWMANKTVLPNGSERKRIDFNNELISQDQLVDHNNYRVYIFVMPEVLCGSAWTNEVCINYK